MPASSTRRRTTPRPTTGEVLSQRRLNRAMLARQLLLEPTRLGVVDAVEQVGGLQAQEPASPFIGLWARLADFDAADLAGAIEKRDVVKGSLMRATLHLVSAGDFRSLWPTTVPMIEHIRRQDRVQPPSSRSLTALRRRVRSFTSTPQSLTALRDHVGEVDGMAADELLWWLRRRLPMAHVPTGGVWSFGRRPLVADADAWLGDGKWASLDAGVEHLVRRYLGGFGPGTLADIAQWSGLPVARIRPGVEAVEAAGQLRRFRSERGRSLIDLADAPLPPEDTPAPPRLLPMWDSTLLAYADRTRIISDDHRTRVIARNGDTLPVFLVDGVVAGRWWAIADGKRTRLELEPFGRLAASDRRALDELADRLATFVEPREPGVYARYQRWRNEGR